MAKDRAEERRDMAHRTALRAREERALRAREWWIDGDGKMRDTSPVVRKILAEPEWAAGKWRLWECGPNPQDVVNAAPEASPVAWYVLTREEVMQLQYRHAAAGMGELPVLSGLPMVLPASMTEEVGQ